MGGGGLRSVALVYGGGRSPARMITVDDNAGVDLGSVGRALGLDPRSVRLNRYFVSRGPDHVSTAVKWGYLLSFFASRSLPAGESDRDPVVVQGKPLISPPGKGCSCSERKVNEMEDESSPKNSRADKPKPSDGNNTLLLHINSKREPSTEDAADLCSRIKRRKIQQLHCKRHRENEPTPMAPCKKRRPQFLEEDLLKRLCISEC